MSEFKMPVRPFETDIFGFVPVSTLLRLSAEAAMRRAEFEGWSQEIMAELGAVWMIAKIRMEQFCPVWGDDELILSVSPRSLDRATYLRAVDIECGGERMARIITATAPVSLEQRRIIRLSVMEEAFCHVVGPPEELGQVGRVTLPEEIERLGSFAVRYSDCDVNGHMSAAKYADVVSEFSGLWRESPRFMRELCIDYSAECLPKSEMGVYGCSEPDGTGYMKGVSADGAVHFSARYELSEKNATFLAKPVDTPFNPGV